MGTRSEIAVAHFLAVPFNDRIILHGDGGGGDLDFRGYAVQVKSRSRHGGTLLFKTLEQFRAELAVLCSMAGEFVWILGWIWRDEFRSSYKDADYHHGPIVVVEQSQLREPLELLRLPRAATVPR
jgi:hypothetical protein